MLRYGEFASIVSLGFNPLDYNTTSDARDSLQATELLRKHENLPTNIDKSSVAFEAFIAGEETCRLTNLRLNTERMFSAGTFLRIQRKIAEVLGEFNPEEMFDLGGWGPGSTVFITRRSATPSKKFDSKLELTAPLFRLLACNDLLGHSYPLWKPSMHVIEGNKVITVPKNAKTDRIIAVEPSGNLWFQKGIGTMIRRRLKRFGVDLNSQERNRDLARRGSLDSLLATIDFSAASDTISYSLILDLLPWKWFQVLDMLRSQRGVCQGSLISYEKFSSMGNGFTFELESLIFWAIAVCLVPEDDPLHSSISIFGDDLIIPSKYLDECELMFRFCGFTINTKKSFSTSYYRESCGGHYWNGTDITPVYIRRTLDAIESMRFHNRLVELSSRTIGYGFRDKRFRSCISFLSSACSDKFGTCPIGYGDLGLIKSFDEATPIFCRKYQRGWFSYKSFVTVPVSIKRDGAPFALSKMYHLWKSDGGEIGKGLTGNLETLPQRTRYILRKMYFVDWPSLGIWI
jgi:hypothetical protein